MSPAAIPLGQPHIVILVHGIRTFGAWQDRLAGLLHKAEPNVTVLLYKYGYFGSFAFLIPFLRATVVRHFRGFLEQNAATWRDARVDIVAHSFGTHVAAWALRGLPTERRPRIHTLILSGSVLRQLFPWTSLDSRQRLAQRVINDCGRRDVWPLVAQWIVFGAGSAGRHGFAGIVGADAGIVNRYHPFGHSGFFDSESFMESMWVPLLLGSDPCAESDTTPPAPHWTAAIEQYADPVKLLLLVAPIIAALFIWQSTVAARDLTIKGRDARIATEQAAKATAEAAAQKSRAESIQANAEKEREALARRAAEAEGKREQALRLLEQASGKLYRSPHEALLLSLRSAELGNREASGDLRANAIRIMRVRREIAEREGQLWKLGYSWFSPAEFKGKLPVRFSPDGRFLLMALQAPGGEGSEDDAYLIDNETQRVTKLAPPGSSGAGRGITFAGFSSSGARVMLARMRRVEIYDGQGECKARFEFSGPKLGIRFMDLISQDTTLIVGDDEGNVWAGPALTSEPGKVIVRQRQQDGERRPLVSFQLSPSGKWGAMLFMHMRASGPGPDAPITRAGRAYLWRMGKYGGRNEDNRIKIPLPAPALSVGFHPAAGETPITSEESGAVTQWTIVNAKPEPRQTFTHGGHPVRFMAFSTGGGTLYTVADDEVLRSWPISGPR